MPEILERYGDMLAYNADCRDVMRQMAGEGKTVDLTLTSPPYDDARAYNHSSAWDFDVFREVAGLVYRVTGDGGVVVWVAGDTVHDGPESGTSFRQALHFMELGFKLHDTMIYEKNSSSFPARRGSKRYTQIFEYMFVFVKGKMHDCHLIADKENKWAGHTSWGRNTLYDKEGRLARAGDIKPVPERSLRTNIWKYPTGFNTKKFGRHPAVFPLQLAVDHVLSWSLPGHVIFDPFLGSGTTMDACVRTGRGNFMGCEIDGEYCEITRRKMRHYGERAGCPKP